MTGVSTPWSSRLGMGSLSNSLPSASTTTQPSTGQAASLRSTASKHSHRMTPPTGSPSSSSSAFVRAASTSRSASSPCSSSSSSSSSGSSSTTALLLPVKAADAATRCRYKTGRCMNTRVAKPNGTMLLLCELHRDQQNRTKKRSDLKYRQHRSKKRKVERQVVHHHQRLLLDTPVQTPPSVFAMAPPAFASATNASNSSSLSAAALKKATLYKLSSGLRSAALGCRISPGKARMGALRTRTFSTTALAVNRRDIVAMASPHKLPPQSPLAFVESSCSTTTNSPTLARSHFVGVGVGVGNTLAVHPPGANDLLSRSRAPTLAANNNSFLAQESLSAMVFSMAPQCLSPLPQSSPWTARAPNVWHPEDVRLLEYFIL